MSKNFPGVALVGTFVFLVSAALAVAQEPPPSQPQARPSQHGSVSQRIWDTTVTIEYNRPVARGRELFGKLVPYDRIWCPCANEATTFEVSTPIKIDGHELPAGKYSVWTEPRAEKWTIIFNRTAVAWHTRYPVGDDALRIEVTPHAGSHMETLTFYFPVVDAKKAELVLHWGTTVVPMHLEAQ
jgi:Protein of unknown function (DUF2911)